VKAGGRRLHFDSSPASYATTDRNRVRFLRARPSGHLCAAPLIPVDAIKALDPTPEQPKAPEHPCPCCGGPMRIIETFRRGQQPSYRASPPPQDIRIDTS
jgi:hypothetical protein